MLILRDYSCLVEYTSICDRSFPDLAEPCMDTSLIKFLVLPEHEKWIVMNSPCLLKHEVGVVVHHSTEQEGEVCRLKGVK